MAVSVFAKSVIFLLAGCFLIVIGGCLIAVFKRVIHDQISQKMPLKNGTESFETWKDPPVPVYMEFWVFDLQNPQSVVENGSKPILKQRGPFVYREVRAKKDLVFNKNDTISYRVPKTYIFDPELSAESDDTTITTVNLLLVTVVDKLRFLPSWEKVLENGVLKFLGEKLFTKQRVYDLIWGYDVKFLKELSDILHALKININIPYQIGIFAGQNGTDDGLYTIYSGTGNTLQNLNVINKWQGASYLPYWNSKNCNKINGTDGTLYHPFIQKTETLYLFSTDICRSIYFLFDSDQWNHGIHLYRFVPPAAVFGNETTNPDNKGYCTPGCLGAGVLNVSVCKGAPVVVSQPHFYQGAEYYLNAVIGLHPNKEEHESFVDIEPNTGAVMNAAKKIQINIFIQNISGIDETSQIPPTIFPVAWVNETAKIDQPTANKFNKEVMVPIIITQAVQYGLIILGFLVLMIAIVYTSRKNACRKKPDGYQPIAGDVNPEDSIVNA